MQLGQRIKEARERKGLSQRALARLAGQRHSLVSELENNKRNDCFVTALLALAIALDTSMDYLCDRFTAPETPETGEESS